MNYGYQHESTHEELPILIAPNQIQRQNLQAQVELPREVLQKKENQIIYREGQMPNAFYVLKSGCVKVVSQRQVNRGRMNSPEFITRLVGAGEAFGVSEVIRGVVYSSHAVTLKPSEIQVYAKDTVQKIMHGAPGLLQIAMKQLAEDLEQNYVMEQLHYLASVQERIAYQLVVLSDKFGEATEEGNSLNLRLTRNELAQLAGTINESLSRHLTEFKRDGLIDLRGKEIIIKNREGLAAKSGNFS